MLSSKEVEVVVEDLKRASSYFATPESAMSVLMRVADDVAKITEQIERANGNACYSSPYSHSARPSQPSND